MNSTRSVLEALGRWHSEPRNGSSRAWVFAEEVRISPGFTAHPGEMAIGDPIRVGREQHIDAFAIHTWPSKRFVRRAYEVKSSRADMRRDLQQPWKQDAALALSNEFYLAVPSDLSLDGFEFPPEWGVLTIGPRHGLRTIKRAPLALLW